MRPSAADQTPVRTWPPPIGGPAAALAVALPVALAALFAGGVVLLALGRVLTPWLLGPAVLAGSLVGSRAWARAGVAGPGPDPGPWLARAALLALAMVALASGALAAAARFHDVSWDGQVYHQPAVIALAGGWNPLWDGPLPLADRPDNLWINHYPKAAWVLQAVLFQATGSLESTKGVQLLALLAAGLCVFVAFGGGRRGALLAALAAANPVGLVQLYSFYVDGLTASLITAFLALAWAWWRRPGAPLALAMAAALVLLVNLKFTGAVYGAVLCAGLALAAWHWHPWRLRPFLAVSAAALTIGVLALGFDPYVINTRTRGHPFHPVAGRGAVDFLTIQLAPEFHERSRPERLAIGLFARASNENRAPELKPPFTIQARELGALPDADLRLGGFGPLFGGIVLLALALAIGHRLLGFGVGAPALGLGALLLGSAFCNPALWWARYVPQLWLLPVGLGALLLGSRGLIPAGRLALAVLATLLFADAALVGATAATAQWRISRQVDAQLAALRPVTAGAASVGVAVEYLVRWNGFDGNRARLAAAGLAARPVNRLPCVDPIRILRSDARLCPEPAAVGARAP